MTRAFALGVLTLALTGCGTVSNFTEGGEGRMQPYGGVKIAVKQFKEADDVGQAFLFPFFIPDVALSAIGDTLTLPITLAATASRAIDVYRALKQPPLEGDANWREFWFNEPPAPSPPTPAPSPATPSAGR